nr:PGF-pre-PGF domain-containing protein [uncultured Methanoregula sp.]
MNCRPFPATALLMVFFLVLVLCMVPAASAGTPTVSAITPSTGSNLSSISLSDITGTGFASGAALLLTPVNVTPIYTGNISNGAGGAVLYNPSSVYVSGNYAYVASYDDNALEIVNVTDPASPTHAGKIIDGAGGAALSRPYSVYVSGNYAYVASQDSNALEIVNVTNPASPTHAGKITNDDGGAALSYPHSVYVSGNYAYVASERSNALEIVNVTDPASPTHAGTIRDNSAAEEASGAPYLYQPQSVYVSGNYAYVVSNGWNSETSEDLSALEIVNVADPANPTHAGCLLPGSAAYLSGPKSVYVSGNYAYVASPGSTALEIVNVTNPATPTHAGKIIDGAGGAALNNPESVYVSGNYAYLANNDRSGYLEIVDVTDPANPVHKNKFLSSFVMNWPRSVYVTGNYTYMASWGNKNNLDIVDVGTISGTGVTTDSATHIHGTINPVGKATGKYNVVVTNPGGGFGTLANGFTLTNTALPPAVTGVSPVTGQNTTTALLVNLTGTGFNVGSNQWAVNLTKAGQPNITATSLTSTATTINCTFNLAGKATGNWFVNVTNADGQTGNWTGTFAITTPTPAPTVTSITPHSGLNSTSIGITNLAGSGFYGAPTVNLTRAGYSNITATSVTVISSSNITCTFDLTNRIPGTWNVNVTNPDGQQAALLNGFTITNATPAPTVSAITPSSGLNTTSISITDIAGTGFASGASLLLTPVNLTPVYKGRIADGSGGAPYLDQPQSVYVSGNYAYVASYNSNALEIVNVTDKSHPVHEGSLTDGSGGAPYLNQPNSVYVSGNYAYVASDGSSALEIVNVTDPANPSHAGSIIDGDDGGLVALYAAKSVYVSGNYAYVASYASGALEIVNVTDPVSPTHKGKITNGDGGAALLGAYSVFVSGNYAYVASQNSNALEIVDVTDPASPTHKGKITNGGIVALDTPTSVYVSGNYAYVTSQSSNALEIVNVTDPASPTHAGKIVQGSGGQAPFVDQPMFVYVSGNYAYVASYGNFCIEVVDVTDPANPVHKGWLWGSDTVAHPLSIYVSENYVYYGSCVRSNALEITDIGTITGTGVTTDSATHIHGTINPVGKAAGKYNVVVTNPAGGFGVLASGFTVSDTALPPAVTGVSPVTGQNTTTALLVNLTGTGFTVGSNQWAVNLTKAGQPNITATSLTSTATTINGTFNLAGKATGDWFVNVTNADGQAGYWTGTFAITNVTPAPTVTGITPSSGLNTTSIGITNLAGTGFYGTPVVNLTRVGYNNITATGVTLVSANQLTCTFDLTNKIPGTWNVNVTNPDGQQAGLLNGFTITNVTPAPTVSAITPTSGQNSTSIGITNLAGTGFYGSPVVNLTRVGYNNITATGVTLVSANQLTCTFDLTNKIPGTWNVNVTNPDGQQAGLLNGFTITNVTPAPTVSAITPTSGLNTTSIGITNLAGTGFYGTPVVNLTRVGYNNITATGVTLVSANQLTCTFDLTNKIPGTWNVNVTNPDGQQAGLLNGFTITNVTPAPTVSAITPTSGQNSTSIGITNLAGTGFYGSPTVNLTRAGFSNITATGVTLVSANQLTCTFDLTNKIPGTWNVNVTNPDGQQAGLLNGFTITNVTPAPTVSAITPTSGQNSTSIGITNLAGTGFYGTPVVNLTRVGYNNITATGVTLVSANQLTCTFDLTNKIPGTWTVNVTNPDGQQAALLGGFSITNTTSAPTVTGITPSNGQNTTGISITNLAGTGFYGTPTVNLTRAGYSNITATGVTLVSANQLTCTFDLTNKIPGTWNVNVTNPDGQQAALLNGFTITNSSTPTPTPTPTPNPTPTSSGGGDVGPVQRQQSVSSGSGMSIASGAPAGGTVTYSFGEPATDYPVSIESIAFVPDQSIGQSQCLVTRTSPQEAFTVPDRPAVYESIQINWINPNVMSEATIQFSVKGSWMREHNVGPQEIVMMRQHDLVWAELPTVFDHVANDMYYYRSTTPGFSNFAVSIRKNATITAAVNTTTVTTATLSPTPTTNPMTSITTRIQTSAPIKRTSPTTAPVPAPAAQPETGIPVLYLIAGIVIIILGVAGFFIGRRWWWARQNPALFREYD